MAEKAEGRASLPLDNSSFGNDSRLTGFGDAPIHRNRQQLGGFLNGGFWLNLPLPGLRAACVPEDGRLMTKHLLRTSTDGICQDPIHSLRLC